MSTHQNTIFQVTKSDLQSTKIITQSLAELEDGQVRLKIDKFALTANNITYAVIGDELGYWKFFPTTEDWGIIPVWGFAEVVASKHDAIEVGTRYYGYYPTATYLTAQAGKVNDYGFTDVIAHRTALPPIYNNYTKTSTDIGFNQTSEAMQMIFRPLFTTSFLLDDMLQVNEFFAAQQIILTSASSKTAFALAFFLAQRKDRDYQIVGLTSTRNVDFVKGLGCYDQVVAYDQVENIANASTCIVDFAGNRALLLQLQKQLGAQLKYMSLVGMVHWEERESGGAEKVNGQFFFAPSYIQHRLKEWGMMTFQKNIGKAWHQFAQEAGEWLSFTEVEGATALQTAYMDTLNGKASPKKGLVISLN